MINIVNIKSGKPYDIYIGRANKFYNLQESKWHNPFIIGKHGDRNFCVNKYVLYLNTRPDLLREIGELNNKILACWCGESYCHGNHLIDLVKSKYILNWFSNMKPFDNSLVYQGIEYRAVENFYQAMKLPKNDLNLRAEIAAMSAFDSKRNIRDKSKYTWDLEWSKNKALKVMKHALEWKFQKGTSWHTKLKMTEDWIITEWNNWGDLYWGKDINTENGENHLGKLLMEIRNG